MHDRSGCDLLLGQGQIENVLDRACKTLAWMLAARAPLLTLALDHLSLGRAHLLFDLPAAERDLDEALSIATRGGMRLHEADAQLGFARLLLARGDRNAARACIAAAKTLVERTGYHRRDRDLAEIEAALARAAAGSLPPTRG